MKNILKDLLAEDYALVFKDSVLILDGRPVYINNFIKKYNAEVMFIDSQEYGVVDFKKLKSIEVPSTGMVNIRGVCLVIHRIPARKFKHGINAENVIIKANQNIAQTYGALCKKDVEFRIADSSSVIKTLTAKSLTNTFLNTYPSFHDALKSLGGYTYQVAFDRQFAIDIAHNIFFETLVVGKYEEASNSIHLFDDYKHLINALPKELLNGNLQVS